MESNVPMAAVQDVDNESDQVVTDCLRVSVVLRTIFQHFSTTGLFKLSLVNKCWSYEARSLLRDRGNLTGSINKNKKCQNLGALASDLRRTKKMKQVLPFSGLTISLGGEDWTHQDCCTESSGRELDEICEDILDQLTWKHLSIQFCWHWTEELKNCPAFLLVKKILEKFSSILEEFTIRLPVKSAEILEQILQGSSFSRLKTFKIQQANFPSNSYTNLIKTLISHAPNLKVLQTSGWANLSDNLLEGSSAIHVTDYPFSPFLNQIPENVAGGLRMTRMELLDISQDFQLDRFNRITSGLLEASRTTLNLMHIDVIFLVPLMAYGICLENVRTLEINLNQPQADDPLPDLWRLAKSFDFTRTFPNLQGVKLILNSNFNYVLDGIHEMVELGNAAFREPTTDRAVNIKNLSVERNLEITDSGLQLLAEMFPNVEVLSLQGTEIPFGRIWESWPNLKSLDVNDVPMRSVVKNLDSVFCGIFPEEVVQLREHDEEYLRTVNIVPVMPSITCLKFLRNLNLLFGESYVSMESVGDSTYLFSKVTALIAFQRCPDLAVNLITNETRRQLALSHLKPYVNILPED